MQRDMDLIRDLLLFVEGNPVLDGNRWFKADSPEEMNVSNHSLAEINYHLAMLIENGFMKGKTGSDYPMVSKLTWEGHEFLDDIKDSSVWESTKARIAGLPGVALAVIAELAKAEIKKKLGL